MNTFGEVSYNDDVYGDNKKTVNNKDLYFRLKEGTNELRLVTVPHQYIVHKYKAEGDKGFGTKIMCSAAHGSCPVCDIIDPETNKPKFPAKLRWFFGAINRDTGKTQILDVGFAVYQQLRKWAKNAKWGDPAKYDIDIVVDPKGGATGYYTVQVCSKEPLSAEDQKKKDEFDLIDLKRRCTPPTVEFVLSRLENLNGVVAPANGNAGNAGNAGKTAAPKVTNNTPAQVSMSDDEDDSPDFPAYDANAS